MQLAFTVSAENNATQIITTSNEGDLYMVVSSGLVKYACIAFLCLNLLGIASLNEAKEVRVVHNKSEGLWETDTHIIRRVDFIEDLIIGGEGKKNEVFGRISDIAVDTRGDIYVLDFELKRVHVYDSTGSFLLSFGREGKGPGEFSFPSAIYIDKYDEIFIADRDEVDVFDLGGNYSKSFPIEATSAIGGLKKDSKGNIFLSFFEIFDQNIIHKYDSNGEHLISFCDSYAKGKDIDVRAENTFAGGHFDIDKEDVIYFTQKLPYEIRKFDCQGNLLSRIYRENSFMKPPDEFVENSGDKLRFFMPTFSSSIAVLPDGMFINSVFVVDDSERRSSIIDIYDSGGQLLTSKTYERPLFFGCSDKSGYVYAADNGEYAKMIRYKVMVK